MKKRFSLLLITVLLALLFGVTAFAAETPADLKISVDKTEAEIGDTITITIYCDTEITGIQGWGMDLYLDNKAYKLKEATVNDGYNEMFGVITDNISKHSSVNISAFSMNEKYALSIPKDTPLAILTFEVIGDSDKSFQLRDVGANPFDSTEQLLKETSNAVMVEVKTEKLEYENKENSEHSEGSTSNTIIYGNGNNKNTNDSKTSQSVSLEDINNEETISNDNRTQNSETGSDDESSNVESVEVITNNSVNKKLSLEAILLLAGTSAVLIATAVIVFLEIRKKKSKGGDFLK